MVHLSLCDSQPIVRRPLGEPVASKIARLRKPISSSWLVIGTLHFSFADGEALAATAVAIEQDGFVFER